MASAPKRPATPRPAAYGGGLAPRKLQVGASVAPLAPKPSVDVEADTAHAVAPDFDRALERMIERRTLENQASPPSVPPPPSFTPPPPQAFAAPPPPSFIPPPPPSTPPSRMPSRAAIFGGTSFAPATPSSPSLAPVVTSVTPPSVYDPRQLAPAVQALPASRYPMPAPASSRPPPPPSSAPVAYERAFRRWSHPEIEIPQDSHSTEALSYQVYTPDALSSRPRLPSAAAIGAPPKRGNLFVRAGLVMLGIAFVVGTGAIGLAAASDDAPKSAPAAANPLTITTTTTGLDTFTVTPTPPAAVLVVEDAPAAAPAEPAAPSAPSKAVTTKAATKKRAAAGTTGAAATAAAGSPAGLKVAALPPNPYDDR